MENCRITQTNTEWLGYKLSESGVKPIDEKIQAISDRLRPKKLGELRSLMRALNQMNMFVPNLARTCAPLRPLLCKTNEWKWTDEHEKIFQTIKKNSKKITKIKQFKRNEPSRIVCDVSRDGIATTNGARLESNKLRIKILDVLRTKVLHEGIRNFGSRLGY